MGALSLTVDKSELKRDISPFLPSVGTIPYANCYRCIFGQEYPGCSLNCISHIEYLFEKIVKPEEVAGIFFEPIQAHGGVIVPPEEYLKQLRKLSAEHGILMLADEVVTGFGRTGKMFGVDNYGIVPDVMYFGKPIGSGMPLGAILAKKELMDNWTSSGPASTLAGNPYACARSLAMIKLILSKNLLQNAERLGKYFYKRFKELAEKHSIIGDIRGKGLLIGVELVSNLRTKRPISQKVTKHIHDYAFKRGFLINTTSGMYKNIIKLSPPLILTEKQAEAGMNIIENAIKEIV
jgi:4-aminobutyrate aminotransferase-like enzyme